MGASSKVWSKRMGGKKIIPRYISVVYIFRLIVDKIDKDGDGFVSREELKDWIQYTQKRYITDDVERQWKAHNPENKEKLSWEEYKRMVYGFMDGKKTVITDDKIFLGDQAWQFDVDV
jgi:hypothetical protein